MKEITLYNIYHNGDIFHSRMLTNVLKLNGYDKIYYYHRNFKNLFEDDESIIEIDELSNINSFAIDTWIAREKEIYNISDGCSFNTYKKVVNSIVNSLGLNINYTNYDLLPTINFKNLPKIVEIKKEFENIKYNYNKIILICNGNVESGQADNFDFNPIIEEISKLYDEILVLTTKETNLNLKNIICTSNITKLPSDLLYISYLSTFCDIIIGRASGPYCFTHIKENLLNPNKTIISCSFNQPEGIWYEDSVCKKIHTNDKNQIINLVKENI